MQKILGEVLGVRFEMKFDVKPTRVDRLQLTDMDTHEYIFDEEFVGTPWRNAIRIAAHKAFAVEMVEHNDLELPERIAEALGYGAGSE